MHAPPYQLIFTDMIMSKQRRKQQVCAPIYCENPICPQGGKAYTSMSAYTQHIGRPASCQTFLQTHLVGNSTLLRMTRENPKASAVVTNNKNPLCYVATCLTKYRLVLTMKWNLDFEMLPHTVCHPMMTAQFSTTKEMVLTYHIYFPATPRMCSFVE